MGMVTLVLLLTIAVLLSAVIDQLIPRVSLPLIQVVMGIFIALLAGSDVNIDFDPDVFLVLFIAPLLYIEAKDADKGLLWRTKGQILLLAIGLVIVTALCIGFTLNAIMPVIPLAAAFALGGALGPTDAVAVTSLSKQVSIPERLWGQLKGELLLNDASGIVTFQFALAAVITGVFSIWDASITFAYEFIGGLAFGFALGYGANFALRKIRDLGIESTTFHVLFEICIPFIVYLTADAFHVSGIIAVVVAGLVNVIAPRTTSPAIAHMNIVSSNVWDVISFTLNGIVFVLLGTQLPSSMNYAWRNSDIANWELILIVVVITMVLIGVRFLWCLFMEEGYKRSKVAKDSGESSSPVRNALILACCGSKGTITLSILFTIPFYTNMGDAFPARNLILFIGCGVILCTMLIANFCVPLVCPKKERPQSELEARQNYYETLGDILRNVIEQLTINQTSTNRIATHNVIQTYQDRLENTKEQIDIDETPAGRIRMDALNWEQARTMVLMYEDIVSREVGLEYLRRLEKLEEYIEHRRHGTLPKRISASFKMSLVSLRRNIGRVSRKIRGKDEALSKRAEEMRKLQLDTTAFVIDALHEMIDRNDVNTEEASRLLLIYEQRHSNLKGHRTSVTKQIKIADESEDILRTAYQIELEQIQKMFEKDRINRQEANRMRDNVHMMQMDIDDKI